MNNITKLEAQLLHVKYLIVLEEQHKSAQHYLGKDSPGALTLAYAIKYLKGEVPPQTAWEHFQMCGPFCTHTAFCEACAELHRLCPDHKDRPEKSARWKEIT